MPTSSPYPKKDAAFQLIEYIRSWNRWMKVQPLWLGGQAGSPGSVGRPGGYIGMLPQNRVGYDTVEAEYSSGGSTLKDNLAHDRYRLTTYMRQIANYEDSGGSICSTGSIDPDTNYMVSGHESGGSGAWLVGFSPGSPAGVDNVQQAIEKLYNEGGSGFYWHTFTFTVEGTLSISNGILRFYAPGPMTISEVAISISTAPTGQSAIVDINKNGTTIFTNQGKRPECAAGANFDTSDEPDVTALAKNDYLTMDVDQIGSTVNGGNMVVHVRCKQYIQGA